MNLLDVLPNALRDHMAHSRHRQSPIAMTYLFLKNNSDVERTLQLARESEGRWMAAIRKYEAEQRAAREAKTLRVSKPRKPKVSEDELLARLLA